MFSKSYSNLCKVPKKNLLKNLQADHGLSFMNDFIKKCLARATIDPEFVSYVMFDTDSFSQTRKVPEVF
ncbi:hypothetical protein [Peromfec virus RodF5_3]|uniref:Uncharacterized protein n=1 Tax=Peromfec virus RodF5_3 TaxID=2929339 RepID=A0A976R8W3_9VIRU|nr:hypothetical protein [Peromfec virus RodF5_3]